MASLPTAGFYSDSRNDIPLLEQVNHPVAVDPDDALRAHAQDKGLAGGVAAGRLSAANKTPGVVV